MKTLDLAQGSPEWVAYRGAADRKNASEASAMMGASANLKRGDLVRMKATGSEKEFSSWVEEVLFTRGHEVEAAARPLVEAEFDIELFPVTGESDDYPGLSASFDGITMAGDTVWECKQWAEAKAADVRAGRVPAEDRWQCVQQAVVSRCKRLIYTVSDGTAERTVSTEMVPPVELEEKRLLRGWQQFDADVAAYVPETPAVAVVGKRPDSLPALLIAVTGAVTQSNLPEFKARALEVFDGISTDLQTDEDFASAELSVKFCKEMEVRLGAAKDQALGQTRTIAELFAAIDEISAAARQKRLDLEKYVKARKESVRLDHIRGAEKALQEFCETINNRLHPLALPAQAGNFAGVIKGLKTVASVKEAISTELARAKIEATAIAERVDANRRAFAEHASDHQFLFADMRMLAQTKETLDLVNLIRSRIADHDIEQQRRADARAAEDARRAAVAPAAPPAVAARATQASAPPPVAAASPKPRMRATGPSEQQVVELVARTYGVTEAVAAGWLVRMDFSPIYGEHDRAEAVK